MMTRKRSLKRGILAAVSILFVVILGMSITSAAAMAADWPMYRNTAGNSGYSSETINLPLTERWHSNAPQVEENGVVVSNGVAYMSTEDGYLYAFNVATGETVSGFPVTTAANYGTPAVDAANGKVYAAAGSNLFAFNLDGTSAWTQAVGYASLNCHKGPALDDGYVYVVAGGNLSKYSSGGSLQWATAITGWGGYGTQAAIMGDYAYVNSESGYIRKYDKATGAEVTTGGFPISASNNPFSVTAADGKIFYKGNEIFAYNASDGSLIWSAPAGGNSNEGDSPAVANGVVYVYGWNDGKIYAFDENTGATIAGFPSVDLNPGGDRNWNSPTIAGDKIFVGAGTSQKLKVLGAAGSANAGLVLEEHLTFSTDPQGFDLCSPVVSDGVVFAMLDGGGLYAFFGAGTQWTGGSIVINGGDGCTESQLVSLALDRGSNVNVNEMRISEDPLFTGVAWQAYATAAPWTLSAGYGTKTVYVQFRDTSGTLSNVFNDQIEYSENCGGVLPVVVSCDSAGNPIEQFAAGQTVYAKGSGFAAFTTYRIWIQDEAVAEGDALVPGEDPSGSQEDVTTDGDGAFGPVAIWAIPADAPITYHEYDIVVDRQDGGNVGSFSASSDGIDALAAVGFVAPVPEVTPFILLGIGLLTLGGWAVLRKREAAA